MLKAQALLRVAIVGSGPAGFYTAQKLLKRPNLNVDIYEKLPVPFGLVRYGVAPDHQDVKNVINSFTSTITNYQDRVNFYGNVNFGQDISLDNLIDAYHAVVLCYGTAQDKLLNIEGESTSKNTISARNFVGWYNGLPEDKDLNVDLECDTACIIGQGNVALDCARILLKPKSLARTDITEYAQHLLSKSRIKRIYIIGRRGPIQASFTIKELRELIQLSERRTQIEPNTVFQDVGLSSEHLDSLSRQRKRMTELLMKTSSYESAPSNGINVILKFMAKPVKILADENGKVCQLELQKTHYKNLKTFLDEKAKPDELDDYETINCGLIIRSIGYRAIMVDKNLPIDHTLGAIMNTDGRVHGYRSLFCSGWLATGASGVIAGTLQSSIKTANSIIDDIEQNRLPNLTRTKPGHEFIRKILESKAIQEVHFNDWLRIDELERCLGAISGKNREKLVDINRMLEIARGDKAT